MRNCLACQDKLFVNNPFDGKENDDHSLDFVLRLSCLFRSALNLACPSNTSVQHMLSSLNACLIIARGLSQFLRDLHKIPCILAVGSLMKSHQARYTTPNKM
jgi:hypothetical protein